MLNRSIYADDIIGGPFAFALTAHLERLTTGAARVIGNGFNSIRAEEFTRDITEWFG